MPTVAAFSASLLAALPDGNHSFFSVAFAILGIGLLIFVHEMGHFLACRLTKTRVETFSMGFGPRLFGFETRDGVRRFTVGARQSPASEGTLDVRLSAIPLGGYVKMAGETGGDGSPGASDGGTRVFGTDEYPSKPFLAKAFIISAGVIMNVITALVLFGVAYGSGLDETPPVVGAVMPGEPAWTSGIRAGDRIVSYDGSDVRSFDSFRQEILFTSSSDTPEVVVERAGAKKTLTLRPRYDEESGMQQAGVLPVAEWTVDDGATPAWKIGTTDRGTIDGRPFVGGRMAAMLTHAAWSLGKTSVVLEVESGAARAKHEVRLPAAPTAAVASGAPKLGVVMAASLVVAAVLPESVAAKTGVLVGDRFRAVDGREIDRPDEIELWTSLSKLTVVRAGKDVVLDVGATTPEATAAFLDGLALGSRKARSLPAIVLVDGRSFPGGKSPAAEAGIRTGDEVVSIAKEPVATWDDLLARGKGLAAQPVAVEVRGQDGVVRSVEVTPKVPLDASKGEDFFFGPTRAVVPKERVEVGGVFGAVSLAAGRVSTEIRNIFRMIGRFFGGEISPAKNLGGPGTIVNLSSRTANEGLATFLAFLAFISVNLAVLNILPIPVLDGGSLFILIVEKLRGGKPLKETTVAVLQWAGFALLMLLMVFAVKNDFGNLSK